MNAVGKALDYFEKVVREEDARYFEKKGKHAIPDWQFRMYSDLGLDTYRERAKALMSATGLALGGILLISYFVLDGFDFVPLQFVNLLGCFAYATVFVFVPTFLRELYLEGRWLASKKVNR